MNRTFAKSIARGVLGAVLLGLWTAAFGQRT